MKRRSALPSKKFILLLILTCLLWSYMPESALGQQIQRIEIPSSPNPVGSGARALGMGGAFIAIADDATAASWNPGGLIQLERPEISAVGAFFHRIEDNDFGTNPEASGNETVTKADLNYLSFTYPFSLFNHNMVVSLNYQNLYDFTRQWDFSLVQSSTNLSVTQDVSYKQEGDIWALGLAYCIELTPKLSFGFTLNIWDDFLNDNGWKQTTSQNGSGTFNGDPFIFASESRDRFSSFSGINANLGILWNITDKLTFGAVFKTPFTADIKHKSSFDSSIRYPTNPGADSSSSSTTTENVKLDMPMSYGIGLAYRFSDQLTVSADVYRTEWDDFILKDSHGNKISPITGLPASESDVDPTYQVRMGAEYLLIMQKYVIPLRGGIFYDPAPAEGSPDDFYGLSIGSGVALKRFALDISYQYRFGRNVGEDILKGFDFSQDVDEHTVYASLILYL